MKRLLMVALVSTCVHEVGSSHGSELIELSQLFISDDGRTLAGNTENGFSPNEMWVVYLDWPLGTVHGDLDLCGSLDVADVDELQGLIRTGQYDSQSDFDFDGEVDGGYEQGPRPAAAVPEPLALRLLPIGLLAFCLRSRRRVAAIKLRAAVLTAILLVSTGPAMASVIALHQGDNDPETEGWRRFRGNVETFAVRDDDGSGLDAWAVNDNGGADGFYGKILTAEQIDDAVTNGWRLSARLRVVDGLGIPGFGDSSVKVYFHDGARAFEMNFIQLSDGRPLVRLGEDAVEVDGTGYHLYEFIYDEKTGYADFLVDGQLSYPDFAGVRTVKKEATVFFGSTFASGTGAANYNLVALEINPMPKMLGDFNDNKVLDVADIDLLSTEARAGKNNPSFDLNGDAVVNSVDRQVWINDLKDTYFGDSDLNGLFDSKDLVQVFTLGEYEDDVPQNSAWQTGDWDGDGDFTSQDMVKAFLDGGYEQGPRPTAAVPEPSSLGLLLVGGFVVLGLLKHGGTEFTER